MVKRKGKSKSATMDAVRRDAAAMAELAAAAAAPMAEPAQAAPTTPDDTDDTVSDLTERVVDALAAAAEGCRVEKLAPALAVDTSTLRAELMELEKLGMVYRTGKTRGTRWFLA